MIIAVSSSDMMSDVLAFTKRSTLLCTGLTNPDGKVSYAYSANGIGFWIAEEGSW